MSCVIDALEWPNCPAISFGEMSLLISRLAVVCRNKSQIWDLVRQSPALSRHFRKRKIDLYYVPAMAKFQPLARNSDTLDGLNASFVIMDELHDVKDRNLYEVMRQSMAARRQSLLIVITTAGTVQECVFDDMYPMRRVWRTGRSTPPISCLSCVNWTIEANGQPRRHG